MSIDVSGIVPTYNTGEYLDKTMQSLVGQSLDRCAFCSTSTTC
jgi:glycosyltransferase involved in cell wall biosynthesis